MGKIMYMLLFNQCSIRESRHQTCKMFQIYLAEKKSPIRVKDVGGNNRVVQNPQRWGFQDGTLVGSRLLLLVGLIGSFFLQFISYFA